MNRRTLLAGLASGAALVAAPAFALTYAEDIVNQLSNLGFRDIHVETTLLGRVKIVAARGDGVREIVLNPRTGEILRDVWTPSSGGGVRAVLADVEDDDDGDDDGTSGSDDDKDDDNSGSGSGKDDDEDDDDNSGSGSGGDDRDDDRNDDRDDRDDRDDDKKDD